MTYDELRENAVIALLDSGEQPHHLVKGSSLFVEKQGRVINKANPKDSSTFAGMDNTVTTLITDRRIICNIENGGNVTIPYHSITSVEWGYPPEDEWSIKIPFLGDIGQKSQKLIINTGSQSYYISTSENPFTEDRFEADEVDRYQILKFIRSKCTNTGTKSDPEVADNESPLDKIERLKELNEAGAITDEEFQEKKEDLLDQI